MSMPSITIWGLNCRMSRSLQVPGSPSWELHTRYFCPGNERGMKLHFRPVGKPAPPRPRRPDSLTMASPWSAATPPPPPPPPTPPPPRRPAPAPGAAPGGRHGPRSLPASSCCRSGRRRFGARYGGHGSRSAPLWPGTAKKSVLPWSWRALLACLPQPVHQLIELVAVHEAAHRAVVDQQHRRIGAGPQAFAGLQREQAVVRGAAAGQRQFSLQMLQGLSTTAQLAGQVGADVDLVLAHRLPVVHVVEGRDLVHRDRGHAQVVGHQRLAVGADMALLLLHDGQAGHDRRLLLVCRVLGHFTRKTRQRCFVHHRSISPNTMSMVPMMATASAIMWPRAISSSVAKCAKPGARIFRR